jgi:hypothetical protein
VAWIITLERRVALQQPDALQWQQQPGKVFGKVFDLWDSPLAGTSPLGARAHGSSLISTSG